MQSFSTKGSTRDSFFAQLEASFPTLGRHNLKALHNSSASIASELSRLQVIARVWSVCLSHPPLDWFWHFDVPRKFFEASDGKGNATLCHLLS